MSRLEEKGASANVRVTLRLLNYKKSFKIFLQIPEVYRIIKTVRRSTVRRFWTWPNTERECWSA